MAVLRMNLREWKRYHEKLAERFHPAALRGARSAALAVTAMAQRRTRTAPPANPAGKGKGGAVNTGDYLRRWRWISIPDGARVLNDHPAAAVIEYGRRPGSAPPPPLAIRDWLIRRLRMKEAQANRVARAVAIAIGRRGLLARHVLTSEDAVQEIARILEREVKHELDRELARRP